jgi:two-component system, NarL family, invasion response regulator UvrY
MTPVKVALVDDHCLFTESLSGIINGFGNYKVVFQAINGMDLKEKLNSPDQYPDILLLDIGMKVMNGFETAEYLRMNHPSIKVLAVSLYDDEKKIVKMLRLGCKGYLLKEVRASVLRKALDDVMRDGFYYSENVTGKMVHTILKELDTNLPTDQLNPREPKKLIKRLP